MWYESLPSLAIIGIAMVVPNFFVYATNRLVLGNPYKRWVSNNDHALHYLRDMRLSGTGTPYDQVGLDTLFPDEEAEKK